MEKVNKYSLRQTRGQFCNLFCFYVLVLLSLFELAVLTTDIQIHYTEETNFFQIFCKRSKDQDDSKDILKYFTLYSIIHVIKDE